MNPRDERKNLKRDASALFAGGIGASVFAALEVVVLARFLGLEQFGVFSLVLSYVGLVNTLFDFKIGDVSVKYVSEYMEKGDLESVRSFVKFFYLTDLFSGVLAFAVCIIFAGMANEFFLKSEDSFQYVLILSLSLLISTVNQNSHAILQSLKKFKQSGFFKIFHNAVRLVFIAAAYFTGFGLKGFFVAYVVAAAVNFSALQIFVNRTLVRKGIGGWPSADLAVIRAKMREAFWFMFNSAAGGFISFSFSANVPIMMLGYFSGAEASGLYKAARSVVRLAEKIIGPVKSAVYPALVRLNTRQSYGEFRRVIVYSIKETMKFLLPVCVCVFIFADNIVGVFFGGEFAPAADAMRILTVAALVWGFLHWSPEALMALGMPGLRTVLILTNGATVLIALLVLVPDRSYLGAAWASLAPMFLSLAAAFVLFAHVRRIGRKAV